MKKVLLFEDYVVPWDKVTYCERRDHDGVRIYFVSYGFIDVTCPWDAFVQNVIDMTSKQVAANV